MIHVAHGSSAGHSQILAEIADANFGMTTVVEHGSAPGSDAPRLSIILGLAASCSVGYEGTVRQYGAGSRNVDTAASVVRFIVLENAVLDCGAALIDAADPAPVVRCAVDDREAVEDGTLILAAVKEHAAALFEAVDPAAIRPIRAGDRDVLAPKVDVAIAGAGIRAVGDQDGVAGKGCVDGCLDRREFAPRVHAHSDRAGLSTTDEEQDHQKGPKYRRIHALAHAASLSKDRTALEGKTSHGCRLRNLIHRKTGILLPIEARNEDS